MSDGQTSPARRRRMRQDGDVACSRDVVFALLLAAAAMLLFVAIDQFGPRLAEAFSRPLRPTAVKTAISPGELVDSLRRGLLQGAIRIVPWFTLLMVAALAGHWLQTGWLWRVANIVPNPGRLGPVAGLRKLGESLRPVEIGWMILKAVALLTAAALWAWHDLESIYALADRSLPLAVAGMVKRSGTPAVAGLLLIGTLAALDLALQRWRHRQRTELTPEQIRREVQAVQNDVTLLRQRRARYERQALTSEVISGEA